MIAGKYRLVRVLGVGGMGTVWVAHNTVLDVNVAIKLIHLSDERTQRVLFERMLIEARSAARLGHPSIVRVFDFGETDQGEPFVVMELLHGETLAQLLQREGRMTAKRAIQTLLPIADALSAAHAKGVIHRDVKPENVFLARDDDGKLWPKLLDFGVAWSLDSGFRTSGADRLTGEGGVVGTPAYMSPEQARGLGSAGPSTDVWSFCVVVYEALTHELPFDGDNYNAILRSIIEKEPKPTTDLAAGDEAIWKILKTGLSKAAEERWSSMREMGQAFARWLLDHGVREDICSASIRANWLEVDLGSPRSFSVRPSLSQPITLDGAPPIAIIDQPDVVTLTPESGRPTSEGALPAVRDPLLFSSRVPPAGARRKSRVAISLGIAAVLAVVVTFASLSRSPDASEGAQTKSGTASKIAARAEERPAIAATPPPAASAQLASSAQVASPELASESGAASGSATSASSPAALKTVGRVVAASSATTSPNRPSTVKQPVADAPPARKKRSYDFGF
jgi:eukaryotic-like serine/threonine-protein kinase